MSREDRLRLRRAERAVLRMGEMEREVFLAIRFDEASYVELAEKLRIPVADVERHFASSLYILTQTMGETDPWWRRFWPW